MNAYEMTSVISAAKQDYEENAELSRIYKKFYEDIPVFDKEQMCFTLKTKGDSRLFYVKLMRQVNEIYAAPKKIRSKTIYECLMFMLENLIKNPKHFQVSIKGKKGEKKNIPTSAAELSVKLKQLAEDILGEYVPPALPRRTKGSISSLRRLFEMIYDSQTGNKSKGLPPQSDISSRMKEIKEDDIRDITELIAKVSVHNRVSEYFYNATRNGKKGDDKIPRNKTIAMLDEFARDINVNETYEYVALADKDNIESIRKKAEEEKSNDAFIPLASDFLGNTIVLVGKGQHRSKYYKLFSAESAFIILKHKYEMGGTIPFRTKVEIDTLSAHDIFDSYDEAVNGLRFITEDEQILKKIRFISNTNKALFHEIMRLRKDPIPELKECMNAPEMKKKINQAKKEFETEI